MVRLGCTRWWGGRSRCQYDAALQKMAAIAESEGGGEEGGSPVAPKPKKRRMAEAVGPEKDTGAENVARAERRERRKSVICT